MEQYEGLLEWTVKLSIEEQPANAASPMLVTEFGMVTEDRPVQFLKAAPQMLVTEFGIVTDVKPVQP